MGREGGLTGACQENADERESERRREHFERERMMPEDILHVERERMMAEDILHGAALDDVSLEHGGDEVDGDRICILWEWNWLVENLISEFRSGFAKEGEEAECHDEGSNSKCPNILSAADSR